MVGIAIASMIPSESKRICRSAEATGPLGSRTPSVQPPSAAAVIKAPIRRMDRMLDLVCRETGGIACAPDGTSRKFDAERCGVGPGVRRWGREQLRIVDPVR